MRVSPLESFHKYRDEDVEGIHYHNDNDLYIGDNIYRALYMLHPLHSLGHLVRYSQDRTSCIQEKYKNESLYFLGMTN